jgi:protein-disulfide isomerase
VETAVAAAVRKDFAEGERLGLTGTPSCFINGHYLTGTVKYNTLREIVEQQLATSARPPHEVASR